MPTTRKSTASPTPTLPPPRPTRGSGSPRLKAPKPELGIQLADPAAEPRPRAGRGRLPLEVQVPREAVERRAYEIFLARGCAHGHDLEDWFDAERQLGLPGPGPRP